MSNPLIDIGKLAEPATKLIEKIAEGVGILYEPRRIREEAKAKSDAAIINAKTEGQIAAIQAENQIEVTAIQRRAIIRMLSEEAKHQENMESIIDEALPQLEAGAKPEEIDEDWLNNFFDRGRLVGDEEMRMLWARVLAGEANSPGSFSKRTVNLLNSLEKPDAELFSSLCNFGIVLGHLSPLIYDTDHPIYNDRGIDFGSLMHLESIGLIRFESLGGFSRRGFSNNIYLLYGEDMITIEFKEEQNNMLKIGKVVLSQIGRELSAICGCNPIPGFAEYVAGRIQSNDSVVSVQVGQMPSNIAQKLRAKEEREMREQRENQRKKRTPEQECP
jgi:uncharacterized protein DUF2806